MRWIRERPARPRRRLEVIAKRVLTPHIGTATVQTWERMAQLVIDNLRAFLADAPSPRPCVRT